MIAARLRDIIAHDETFHYLPGLTDEASLLDAGVVDSFGMIALVIRIEEAFGIKVLPEHATPERFRSIASIADYIAETRDGRPCS